LRKRKPGCISFEAADFYLFDDFDIEEPLFKVQLPLFFLVSFLELNDLINVLV
jgi:hypothetical protein